VAYAEIVVTFLYFCNPHMLGKPAKNSETGPFLARRGLLEVCRGPFQVRRGLLEVRRGPFQARRPLPHSPRMGQARAQRQ